MSLLKFLVPFGVSFMQGFLKEYNSPSSAHDAADAVIASGGVGSFRWVAVQKSHARAFKAAYPKAYPAEYFFKIFSKYERSDPEAYRHLSPFALNLCEAVEAYDGSCAVFVTCTTWN